MRVKWFAKLRRREAGAKYGAHTAATIAGCIDPSLEACQRRSSHPFPQLAINPSVSVVVASIDP